MPKTISKTLKRKVKILRNTGSTMLTTSQGKSRVLTRKTKTKKPQIFWFGFEFIKSLKKIIIPFNILMLVVGMNFTGLWAVGMTATYFNDTETAPDNGFTAGYLDFALSQYSFEAAITLDETVSKSTVLVNNGGMDFQYTLEAEEVANEDGFCDALNLQAKLNGLEQYNGDLMSLAASALTVLGTWKFNIELPVDEDSFTNGDECKFDVVFKGWQTNAGDYGAGGFSDEERMSFTITIGKMVVLNEFLPHPDGVAYGFDFGNDSSDMPQGEWVELYNNSTESVDLAGWYLRDATDGSGNKTNITALNTAPATTTIGGKSWLVIYMNKAIYNNTGDIVRLFNNEDVLVDSHTYAVSDFCEIEPSPGDDNSTDVTDGDCPDVPPNKSYARIPDGIGDWVDPIPTPGGVNVLENEIEGYAYSAGSVSFEEIIAEEALAEEEPPTPGEENTIAEEEVVIEEGAAADIEEVATEEEINTDAEEVVAEEEVVSEEEAITEGETAIEEKALVVDDELTTDSEPQLLPELESEPDLGTGDNDNSNQNNSQGNEII